MDSQLKKAQKEKKRLEEELKTLEKAMPTGDACKKLVEEVEAADEPLANDRKADNPWTTPASQGGCCIVS